MKKRKIGTIVVSSCSAVVFAIFFIVNNLSGSAHVEPIAVMEGDILIIRIAAPEVSDLYGYQFQLAYDDTLFAVDGVQSLIGDIPTVFKKNFDGYVLAGGTMAGDAAGYSASNARLCEVKLTTLTSGALLEVGLSKVNIVSSQFDYTEDVFGWTYEIIADNSEF